MAQTPIYTIGLWDMAQADNYWTLSQDSNPNIIWLCAMAQTHELLFDMQILTYSMPLANGQWDLIFWNSRGHDI